MKIMCERVAEHLSERQINASGMGPQASTWFDTPSVQNLDYLATVLAAITGLIHLYEGIEHLGGDPIAIWFLLAGLGFFGAIVLFWAGFTQTLLYAVGIVFTGIQVIAYFVINWPDVVFALGIVDKIVQVVLIGSLAARYRQSPSSTNAMGGLRESL
jgi:hypothetical protein